MTGSTERLYQAIARLDRELSELAKAYDRTYTDYLTALGNAVRHQLVLAAYHLCTQGYPEAFLSLSFPQRQELQSRIRQIAKQGEPLMMQVFYGATLRAIEESMFEADDEDDLDEDNDLQAGDRSPDDGEAEPDDETVGSTHFDRTLDSALENAIDNALGRDAEEDTEEDAEEDADEDDLPDLFDRPTLADAERAFANAALPDSDAVPFAIDLADPETLPVLWEHQPMTPELLAGWQQTLERGILEVLSDLSERANRVLQAAGMLPQKLPPPVLEAASQVEASAESVSGAPNVMNLLVEAEVEGEPSQVARLMAVRLRLSEIEFADATLRSWRDRLRKLSSKLVSVGRAYRQAQRERAVQEAESAWRSSWFDDES